LPIPYERTTSYGKGTAHGPAAILEASEYVELWDEELHTEPYEIGVHTAPPWTVSADAPTKSALADLERCAIAHYDESDTLVVGLGGEHSITAPLVRAARHAMKSRGDRPLGVVQFDAHADLRDQYEGSPYSHACVMRRILEEGIPALSVGVRSLSRAEAELIAAESLEVLWANELASCSTEEFRQRLAVLPEDVYLTFDVDYFDPSVVPATGTPEPGGGTWHSTLQWLRALFESKRVVAMDIVELAPMPDHRASAFTVAKLLYKCIGYWARARA